ncbi:MAG: CehA/McbA family metallohydrolase [Gemmatimonadota bacterium]
MRRLLALSLAVIPLATSGQVPTTPERTYFEFQVQKPARMAPGSPAPKYPPSLKAQSIGGEVLAQFVVDTLGMAVPASFRALRSTDTLFANAVRDALPHMRFTSAEFDGRKVRQLVQQPFAFAISGVSSPTPPATASALAARQSLVRGALVDAPPPPAANARWYKGNTHTHTINSDGDSSPDDVVKWYKEHRYNFLVLTDHNVLTGIDTLNAKYSLDGEFIVVRGEEVTDKFGDKPIHINGLDPARKIDPQGGNSVVEVIQRNVDAIRDARGVPHINHPNFRWAITADELKQIKNNKLFEIYNGHPQVNNLGGGGVPGLEEAWDAILTSGLMLYGIAVDDAHHFKRHDDRSASRPGQGWVVVRAEKLEAQSLLAAMERGDFYASTGVELNDYQVNAASMTIVVKPNSWSKFRIQFIGTGGKVLSESTTNWATYRFRGDEGYVRVRVIESNGLMAWTQPVRVSARP